MKKAFVVLSIGALAASVTVAAPSRVDYNGELVQPNHNTNVVGPVGDPAYAPTGWEFYNEGAGGGWAPTYATGGSANAYVLRNEIEPLSTTGVPEAGVSSGGHGIILGGSGGAGRHGIKQTINTVAGKHYWMVGSAKGSNPSEVTLQWGLSNGTAAQPGVQSNGSLFGGSGTLGKQNFHHGMVATGGQTTAMFGVSSTAAKGFNIYADGFRVLESDINVYSTLQNGGFDGARWNVTNWSNANPADSGAVTDHYMFDGWLPLGGMAGQVEKIAPGLGESGWDDCLTLDVYKGGGRQFFFQRINDGFGPHDWTLEARVRTVNYGNADNRIGIDPTGGMDPLSPNVIWSNTNTANNTWQTLTANAFGGGANGITVFLASGWDFSRGNRIAGGTATGADQSTLSYFDSVTLIPEPATMIFLALGGLACLRRR